MMMDIKYRLLQGVIWFLLAIPYRWALGLAHALAIIVWAGYPRYRKTAAIQMRAALGSTYRAGMPLKVFRNHGDILIDAIRYAYMEDEEIRGRIIVEGHEHLKTAKASGRGIIFITGHIGNWEILAHVPRVVGVDFCEMADIRSNPIHESIVAAIRSRSGATILPPKGKALMLIRELRKGRAIGFVVDKRGDRRKGIMCNVFGMPAITNRAPALIAVKGDAMIVPVYAIKEDQVYRLCFEKPVDSRSFKDNPIQEISDYMQGWVESVVRRYPEQWFWLYSRWIRRSEMRYIICSGRDFRQYVLEQNR
jgi:KDO2-lipid IV(A) lauroyltransferase